MITKIITVEMIGAIAAGAILGAIVGFWVLKKMANGEVDSAKKYKEKTINTYPCVHQKQLKITRLSILRSRLLRRTGARMPRCPASGISASLREARGGMARGDHGVARRAKPGLPRHSFATASGFGAA